MWLILWGLIPLFLTATFAWAMTSLCLEGTYKEDPSWLYGIGWGVVLSATLLIFVVGFCIVRKQDGYTFKDVSIPYLFRNLTANLPHLHLMQ